MKLSTTNENYAATVIRVTAAHALPGLDNLVGVSVFGHQALTQKDGLAEGGELRLAFTAETQLHVDYAGHNDLFREKLGLNANPDAKGYLEQNARIKAIRLRGHRSDALLMPLSSLDFLGIDTSKLREGDVFDTIDGHEICRKYEVRTRRGNPQQAPARKAFARVDAANFPEHFSTANFWRNRHTLDENGTVVVTQKLHGTSVRLGNVPVRRFTGWFGKALNRVAPSLNKTHAVVAGSRKVIKDGKSPGYYATDIWSHWADILGHKIPRGYMVYGEIIGWTMSAEGDPVPIQKNYTYNLTPGDSALYVYRVTKDGYDLPWNEVWAFATAIGADAVPELAEIPTADVDEYVDSLLDERFGDLAAKNDEFADWPITLSDPKTVDEGVCIRQDAGPFPPIILKAKSGIFLQHETKLLDAEVVDIESAESEAA